MWQRFKSNSTHITHCRVSKSREDFSCTCEKSSTTPFVVFVASSKIICFPLGNKLLHIFSGTIPLSSHHELNDQWFVHQATNMNQWVGYNVVRNNYGFIIKHSPVLTQGLISSGRSIQAPKTKSHILTTWKHGLTIFAMYFLVFKCKLKLSQNVFTSFHSPI